jgi:Trk-type K+ transport system membrane component
MMYISIFPVAISIRRTNVYEEKSLGIYAHEDDENASFVGIPPPLPLKLSF